MKKSQQCRYRDYTRYIKTNLNTYGNLQYSKNKQHFLKSCIDVLFQVKSMTDWRDHFVPRYLPNNYYDLESRAILRFVQSYYYTKYNNT